MQMVKVFNKLKRAKMGANEGGHQEKEEKGKYEG